jgi:hypothetical protein
MSNGISRKPKNVRKSQGAATATAAVVQQVSQPVAAAVAEAVAKAVEAPAKKPQPARVVAPAAEVQPAVLNQAPKAPPVEPKRMPVEAAKPAAAPEPQKIVEAPKVAAPVSEAPVGAETVQPTMTSPKNNTTGANIMNDTINRTQEAAAQATQATQQVAQQATEQFRGAMNDANQRSQVAMEKSARIVERWLTSPAATWRRWSLPRRPPPSMSRP